MNKYYHPDTDQYRKWQVPLPTADQHGTEDEIKDNMQQLLPNSWHLSGNVLTGLTSMGKLVQKIPTDYILEGTDQKGLPIFKKIVV